MKTIDLFYCLDKLSIEDVITMASKKTIKDIVKFYEDGFKDIMKFNPSLKEYDVKIKLKIVTLKEMAI